MPHYRGVRGWQRMDSGEVEVDRKVLDRGD